ncbi:hypothetical protein, partial [Serratia sp. ME43]|uniref:hypothetical protein n=1 Tax=Serratia sp. ME43 TaxID=2744256 RepID=UPI001C717A69
QRKQVVHGDSRPSGLQSDRPLSQPIVTGKNVMEITENNVTKLFSQKWSIVAHSAWRQKNWA